MFNEPEVNHGLITGPQTVSVHGDDRGGLAYRSNVDHGLVLGADGGGVVQDEDLTLWWSGRWAWFVRVE